MIALSFLAARSALAFEFQPIGSQRPFPWLAFIQFQQTGTYKYWVARGDFKNCLISILAGWGIYPIMDILLLWDNSFNSFMMEVPMIYGIESYGIKSMDWFLYD